VVVTNDTSTIVDDASVARRWTHADGRSLVGTMGA
jgi:hypothetical protein